LAGGRDARVHHGVIDVQLISLPVGRLGVGYPDRMWPIFQTRNDEHCARRSVNNDQSDDLYEMTDGTRQVIACDSRHTTVSLPLHQR